MRRLMTTATALMVAGLAFGGDSDKVPEALNFTVKSIDGKDVKLSKYAGKVVLVVNVASKCGLTPQYKALQELHKKYAGKGLAILGFPANEFGKQEPGTDVEISEFCTSKYGVEFDMFSKIVVKGDGQHDLYKYLTTHSEPAGDIAWNFEKFLIGRDGKIIARFPPRTKPDAKDVTAKIEAALAAK
ncbi:MAG TPA: glutathione peroxidase [Planctomycetia bacterium]|nr:glutathione peroxidase [Planctomycetia bacterium]